MSPLTGVLTEAWDLYRRFAAHFLLISFVIYLITAVVTALLSLAGVAGAIIGAVISFAATYVVQASLIKAVQDVRDGRADLDFSETVRAAGPYILPVIGASILAGIGITIGFILLIVPGLILLTFWCLIVPYIVIGASGVFDSFRNSWRTVRGYAWNVFGTYVLVFLILIAFSIVLGFVLILLPLWLRIFVTSVVTGTLIAPFLALVATLLYYRLTAAHASQPYTPTGPAGATVWEPPYPTTEAPADSPTQPPTAPPPTAPPPAAPGPTEPPPTEPGATKPYPTTPGPAESGPTAPGTTTPPPSEPGPTESGPSEPHPTESGPDRPPPPPSTP
ncbi:MAG: hypothetical protein ACTHPS_02840 [Streptosporangiaceae bacterium]